MVPQPQQGQGLGSGWIASAQSTPGSRICHGLTASPGEGIDVPMAPGRSFCKPRRNPDLDGPRLTPGQVLRVAAGALMPPPALHMHADSDAPRLPQAWTKHLALKIIHDPLGKGGGMEFKGIACNSRHLLKKKQKPQSCFCADKKLASHGSRFGDAAGQQLRSQQF